MWNIEDRTSQATMVDASFIKSSLDWGTFLSYPSMAKVGSTLQASEWIMSACLLLPLQQMTGQK